MIITPQSLAILTQKLPNGKKNTASRKPCGGLNMKRYLEMQHQKLKLLVLLLVLQSLSLIACGGKQIVSADSPEPPRLPGVPKEALQPPTPSICLPNCSTGLTAERESWRSSLTNLTTQGSSASGSSKPK